MKAFLWSVVFCVAVSVAAGYILIGMEDLPDGSRVTDSVRLN